MDPASTLQAYSSTSGLGASPAVSPSRPPGPSGSSRKHRASHSPARSNSARAAASCQCTSEAQPPRSEPAPFAPARRSRSPASSREQPGTAGARRATDRANPAANQPANLHTAPAFMRMVLRTMMPESPCAPPPRDSAGALSSSSAPVPRAVRSPTVAAKGQNRAPRVSKPSWPRGPDPWPGPARSRGPPNAGCRACCGTGRPWGDFRMSGNNKVDRSQDWLWEPPGRSGALLEHVQHRFVPPVRPGPLGHPPAAALRFADAGEAGPYQDG